MNLKYSVFILSIGVALSVEASNTESMKEALKQQVSQAIEGFEKTDRSAWGFRVSRYENEEGDVTSSVEHYDPSAVDHNQWSLLRINGETPSEKQAQKFVDKKRKETAKKADKSFSMSLREIIQIDSLQLEAEDQENLNASFSVHIERLGDDASDKLRGLLTLNKQEGFIETIEITNTDVFSPMFSAKITDFKLTLSFMKIDNAVLPHEQRLNMEGRFAFVTEILEESIDTFSNYQKIGSP